MIGFLRCVVACGAMVVTGASDLMAAPSGPVIIDLRRDYVITTEEAVIDWTESIYWWGTELGVSYRTDGSAGPPVLVNAHNRRGQIPNPEDDDFHVNAAPIVYTEGIGLGVKGGDDQKVGGGEQIGFVFSNKVFSDSPNLMQIFFGEVTRSGKDRDRDSESLLTFRQCLFISGSQGCSERVFETTDFDKGTTTLTISELRYPELFTYDPDGAPGPQPTPDFALLSASDVNFVVSGIRISPIPVPSSIVLALSGLLMLSGLGRIRKIWPSAC